MPVFSLCFISVHVVTLRRDLRFSGMSQRSGQLGLLIALQFTLTADRTCSREFFRDGLYSQIVILAEVALLEQPELLANNAISLGTNR